MEILIVLNIIFAIVIIFLIIRSISNKPVRSDNVTDALEKRIRDLSEELKSEKDINASLRTTNKKLRALTKRRTNGKDEV